MPRAVAVLNRRAIVDLSESDIGAKNKEGEADLEAIWEKNIPAEGQI